MNHPLQEVKEFQKRERAKRKAGRPVKMFYVSGAKPSYTLWARSINFPFTAALLRFATYRYAQDVANALNSVMGINRERQS